MNTARPEQQSTDGRLSGLQGWFDAETTGDPIECAVWDLSATGARLVIFPPTDVPLEFELRIPQEGAIARVRLVWASGNDYGVQFID